VHDTNDYLIRLEAIAHHNARNEVRKGVLYISIEGGQFEPVGTGEFIISIQLSVQLYGNHAKFG